MQPGDLLFLSVIALVLSVVYNVYQAMRARRGSIEEIDVSELSTQLERFRRELRAVRSDLTSEQQKSETLTRQLAESGRTRSTFLDNMGYFVRAPLNSIIGYSELLLSNIYGELSDAQRERLAVIQRSGNDLLAYITDMLELHRLVSGAVELNLKPVPVEQLINRVVKGASALSQETQVELRQQVQAEIGALFGDEVRIEQVLLQLVKNAIRFTQKGNVTVSATEVRVQNGAASNFDLPMIGWLSDGEWIVLTVSDTGIGIPSEDQASIFDTFYRVQRDQTSDERGLGLGLAIAKRVIELHRGVIWVKSAERQGSTFYVALRANRDIRSTDTQERLLMSDSITQADG
jgi:signal transduction histidine kinase